MCRSDSFCFFKQKTAYAMRISDWSSDVCSSDLPIPEQRITTIIPEPGRQRAEIDIRSDLPESEQGNEEGNDSPQQNYADHAQTNRPGTKLRQHRPSSARNRYRRTQTTRLDGVYAKRRRRQYQGAR